jgi:propionyl-CoA carboxylase alpha chain
MIERLLIANRGEIVGRIARTAHRLGIGTVGVYSEPDSNALHVDSVDIAVALGGASPAESYLRGDAIIRAALDTGAEAIHPGYGFLAENADFARAVGDAGLIWVGPTPEQIELLGDKIAAKKAAIAAGVPTAPLFEVADGVLPDDVPLPALVKAAAGGGGRGMRVVRSRDELAVAVDAGSREAEAAFGDGTVFVEPYIERARHVEVQIVGDQHGSVLHFGERECSIQRRNQKIVEEAPSAGIDDTTRTALLDGAVALASSVGYHGAGTVEFLVAADPAPGERPQINFLEVNTRLQVEHPVSEAITGFDLVELQLRVSSGEPLTVTQDEIVVSGHAIEVRVVAEDPAVGWLPSTGLIDAFAISPDEPDAVRVDTGFRAGSEVSADYDSMLAKVIAHAPTRREAAARLRRALRRSEVTGVRTNLSALTAILSEPNYLAAETPTAYLDDHPSVLTPEGPEGDDRVALLLGAVFTTEADQRAGDGILGFAPSGWRNVRTQGQRQVWKLDRSDEEHHVEFRIDGSRAEVLLGRWPEPTEDGSLSTDDRRVVAVRIFSRGADRIAFEVDGVRRVVDIGHRGDAIRTHSAAGGLAWIPRPRFVEHEATEGGGGPVCPLPGTVIAVHVEPGQAVSEGDLLVVVEAMKMEHKITAASDATVGEVHFAEGDRVDTGDLLVTLDVRESADA